MLDKFGEERFDSVPIACPFCGLLEVSVIKFSLYLYRVHCKVCDIDGPPGPTRSKVVSRWNNRPKLTKKEI